ncbi:MAG TPA: flagellar hook-length control protein FliK [Planctomycetes bacterium]|nr:flagellar hook-length control protein FliK [Planctomycetota bacterium]
MIQINIPPAAFPPSNSERPAQGPSEESGFEDILQARVSAESPVAPPEPSSKGADVRAKVTSGQDFDDSDLADAESLSGAAVATSPVETGRALSEGEDAPVELQEVLLFGKDAEPHGVATAIPADLGGASLGGDFPIAPGGEAPPHDDSSGRDDGTATIPPSLSSSDATSPKAPLPEEVAPLSKEAPAGFEIPDKIEEAAPETGDVVSPPAHRVKPAVAGNSTGNEESSRIEPPSAGESHAGTGQQSLSDSSRDSSSPRDNGAPQPPVGVESVSPARPADQASPPPNSAPASQTQTDATAPAPVEAPSGPSPQSRTEAVIEQVRVHVKPGHSRIAFRLDPPRLGRLSIRLVMRGGRLLGQVRTETQEAAHLLRSGLEGLRSTMREAGIQVDRLEFQAVPSTSPHGLQDGGRDESGRAADWGDAPGGSQQRGRGPRRDTRIERAVLEMANESDDGRLDVVA